MRYKKLCGSLVEQHPRILFVSFSCMMHSCQLIMKTGLNLIDNFLKLHAGDGTPLKYFSTLAKISYVWRDGTKQVYKTWAELYGDVAAYTHCKNIIPKCVAGRWGSIADVEKFLLVRKISNIVSVLPRAFGVRLKMPTLLEECTSVAFH